MSGGTIGSMPVGGWIPGIRLIRMQVYEFILHTITDTHTRCH